MDYILYFVNTAWQTLGQMVFLWQIVLMIFVGIIAAEIIFNKFPNFAKKISVPARPITRLCRLPDNTGTILMSSAFTTIVVANSMLLKQYEEKKLTKEQLITVAILNTAPAYIRRIFTFVLPAFLPLFGWMFFWGVVACNLLVVGAKIIFCIIYSRMTTPAPQTETLEEKPKVVRQESKEVSLKKPLKMAWGITQKMLMITFVIFFLDNVGFLDVTVKPILNWLMISLSLPEAFSLPLMAFSAGSIPAGAGAFGKLMFDGTLSLQEIFVGMSLGMILSQPAIVFRHVIPSYAPIFGSKLTFQIIGISFSIVLIVRILTFLGLSYFLL